MKWPGLIPLARRFLYGSAEKHGPKARHYPGVTPTTSEYYEGMEKHYRWFRQDELVRKCIITNAYFACMTKGYETILEPTDPNLSDQEKEKLLKDYGFVKEQIDELNKTVNMDLILFIAQIKRSIFGKAGFEIVLDEDEKPSRLLPLQSDKLEPNINNDWELVKFKYEGRTDFYNPEEVLYYVNLPLEADQEGLSDIEPVVDVCIARHSLLREDFPEIAKTIWAPFVLLKVDTAGLSDKEADKALEGVQSAVKPGKSIVINESIEGQVLDMKPDLDGLCKLLDKLEQAIIGNFGTPRFLLGKPIENRATAYAELEAYVDGPITNIQRYFKRELERQWCDPQTRKILEDEKGLGEDESLPVVVKHRWNPIRVTDVYEMAKAVAVLWSAGNGAIAGRLEKAWELMGWDPSELEEK